MIDKLVLTGGSGFLGKAILDELLGPDPILKAKEIVVFDLNPFPSGYSDRVSYFKGDVRNPEALIECCRKADAVVHSAAIIDWGTKSLEEILSVNVQGTENVIGACRENSVRAMVYTSSLDVLHDGRPLVDVDEDTPYPEKHSTSYCASKYRAELSVLEANGNGLSTCSLRPADIYGEGDPYHIGSLIDMAKGGFYIRLGNGSARCQHVYVRNAAHAHLLALRALLENHDKVAGQAYFLTDGEATNFFAFFDRFVTGAGFSIRPANAWLPKWFAFGLGAISEGIAFLWRPVKRYSPKLSRFAVVYTCTDYTFSSGKARNDFNFIPRYSETEAFERTFTYFRDH
jgi:nucleoside-diphosphate-sugar epimerase